MLAALLLIGPLFLGSLILYLRCTPKVDPQDQKELERFNRLVLGAVLATTAAAAAYFRFTTGRHPADSPWWPVLAAYSAFGLASVILFIGFMVRAYLYFRKRRCG